MTPKERAIRACTDQGQGAYEKHQRGETCDVCHWLADEFFDAIQAERERCAKIAENTRIIGGETPGPMYEAGWNGACEQAGKWIRDDSFPKSNQSEGK